jgi:UDPglucose 6-dehydrogenase
MGADTDTAKVDMMHKGQCPFFEPGLQELLNDPSVRERVTFTASIDEAIRESLVLFVCVGTPQSATGEADLAQVEALARTIARNLNGYKLIVEKSTVPAITGHWIDRTIARCAARTQVAAPNGSSGTERLYDVASNPEFLQEGVAVENFFHPDRVVCGVASDRARAILQRLYSQVEAPVVFTDRQTAELIKHAANAFLATKISFINMVADISESVGADVDKVAHAIGLDPRIGPAFLKAGLGFGGYCLPKDIRAFIHLGEQRGVNCSLLKEVEHINQRRTVQFVSKVREALWVLRGKTIAVLGLAFKGGTDDVRESPSFRVIELLLNEGANLRLYDPCAVEQARKTLGDAAGQISYCESAYSAAEGADALLVTSNWPEFQAIDLKRLREIMHLPLIVDGRNMFDPAVLAEAGFDYVSMGRLTFAHQSLFDNNVHGSMLLGSAPGPPDAYTQAKLRLMQVAAVASGAA